MTDSPAGPNGWQAPSAFSVQAAPPPTQADLNSFCAAGFSDRQAHEIVLALTVKTLSNYSNHLFHTEVDETFADYKLATAA